MYRSLNVRKKTVNEMGNGIKDYKEFQHQCAESDYLSGQTLWGRQRLYELNTPITGSMV